MKSSIPRITQMQSSNGNFVPNQLIIHAEEGRYFQSYDSIIAFIPRWNGYNVTDAVEGKKDTRIVLDERFWDYSATTGKYRNQFLGENIAETRKKIASGEYKLENLNK